MAFRKTYEVICDALIGKLGGSSVPCDVQGSVMARSKEEANRKLVELGWNSYDKGPTCIHYCPDHVYKERS